MRMLVDRQESVLYLDQHKATRQLEAWSWNWLKTAWWVDDAVANILVKCHLYCFSCLYLLHVLRTPMMGGIQKCHIVSAVSSLNMIFAIFSGGVSGVTVYLDSFSLISLTRSDSDEPLKSPKIVYNNLMFTRFIGFWHVVCLCQSCLQSLWMWYLNHPYLPSFPPKYVRICFWYIYCLYIVHEHCRHICWLKLNRVIN